MFDRAAQRAIARTAGELGVEPAALLAVAEVESGGRAHARVNGRDEPLIRFEGHYFHRRLTGAARARVPPARRHSAKSSSTVGRISSETLPSTASFAFAANAALSTSTKVMPLSSSSARSFVSSSVNSSRS